MNEDEWVTSNLFAYVYCHPVAIFIDELFHARTIELGKIDATKSDTPTTKTRYSKQNIHPNSHWKLRLKTLNWHLRVRLLSSYWQQPASKIRQFPIPQKSLIRTWHKPFVAPRDAALGEAAWMNIKIAPEAQGEIPQAARGIKGAHHRTCLA